MSSSVQSLIDYGTTGLVVDIECHLSNNLPTIVIVGFANRAVGEARERVRGAFASSGIELPRKRITINLAPADIPKDSSGFDLAIAAAILQASTGNKLPIVKRLGSDEAIMGELGLDGMVRPVRGIIGKILAGRKLGITTFYIPASNVPQASLVPDITLVALNQLSDLAHYLFGTHNPHRITTSGQLSDDPIRSVQDNGTGQLTFSDVIGQQQAKRALEIAAAGGHNVLLNGPPGTGKSMLARTLPSILPQLTREEMLEVTHLHSLSGKEYNKLILQRPFRAPHHSTSHIAVIGGGTGNVMRPGEISLAHRGVLFFDELPEFNRPTIEALRQPLEDRSITLARANDRIEYPANFIFIATANPCPCGNYDVVGKICDCPPIAVQRYRSKLSGPILDRIDLYSDVHGVDHANLLNVVDVRQDDDMVRERVMEARRLQYERYSSPQLNAGMSNRDITNYASLAPSAKSLLDTAAKNLDLSARAYMRTIKVARTIADLANSPDIQDGYISEALQYRSRS